MTDFLVTGSDGFIGRKFISKAGESNCIGLDKTKRKDIIYSPIPDTRITIHLAALPGLPDCEKTPSIAIKDNITATCRILRNSTSRRFLFASSAAAATPDSFYGVTKKTGELMCDVYKDRFADGLVKMRFSNVYGAGSLKKKSVIAEWCRSSLLSNKIVIHGNGEQVRDFIYIDDLVDAMVKLSFSRLSGTVDICSGSLVSLNYIAEIISSITGADIVYSGANETRSIKANSPWALLESGWKPQVGITEGIEKTIGYFDDILSKDTSI